MTKLKQKIAIEYGLPVIEGSEGGVSDSRQAKEISKKIGLPVLIKAAGGGGGGQVQLTAVCLPGGHTATGPHTSWEGLDS